MKRQNLDFTISLYVKCYICELLLKGGSLQMCWFKVLFKSRCALEREDRGWHAKKQLDLGMPIWKPKKTVKHLGTTPCRSKKTVRSWHANLKAEKNSQTSGTTPCRSKKTIRSWHRHYLSRIFHLCFHIRRQTKHVAKQHKMHGFNGHAPACSYFWQDFGDVLACNLCCDEDLHFLQV